MLNKPEVVKELFYPEGGGTFLVVLTSRAPAVVPTTELIDEDGITIRVEPNVELWGEENPKNGLSKVEVVTELTVKARVKAAGLEEAIPLGGDACHRVLLLLSLLSNTAPGRLHVKGVLDVTEGRRRRGLMVLGPFVTLPGVRKLTELDIRTSFEVFDKAWRARIGRHLLDSVSQYVRGLNETHNPAEFLCYYQANEKLDPLLKDSGRNRRERGDWRTKDVMTIRNAFLHAITKGSKIEKGDKRVAESGPKLAKRARVQIGELLNFSVPLDYADVDKNQPVQPTILGCIDDPNGAYDGGWVIPSLPSRAVVKGIDASGVFRLDLENLTYDGLPDTTFKIIGKGFQTGGRFIQPTEPPGGSGV